MEAGSKEVRGERRSEEVKRGKRNERGFRRKMFKEGTQIGIQGFCKKEDLI